MRGVASNSITDNIVIENGQWPDEAIQIRNQAGVEAEKAVFILYVMWMFFGGILMCWYER